MRPGLNGEVILKGSRDWRYVRKAAKVAGDLLLAEHVDQCADEEYTRLYRSFYPEIDASDIMSARAMKRFALLYSIVEFKSAEEIRYEVAAKRTNKAFEEASIHLDPIVTPFVLEEMQALAELNTLRAITLGIRRSVAQNMLADFPA